MVIKMKNEALTALVGVSASETPKYLLLNNFLADFFEARSHEEDDYTFSFFEEQGILVCQESNSEVIRDLERSFEKFLQYFTGREMLSGIKSGKEKIYMPLSLDMLGSANVNLRHLLYHLALSGGKPSEEERIREELYQYLYGDSTGIYDIVRRFCGIEKGRKDKVKEPGGFEKLREEPFFKKLGRRFYKDLHSLLTHHYFTGQDFYKRLDDLAMLLTMYVVFYFIHRVRPETSGMPVLLCKGSTDSGLNDGGLHRACTSNYQSFRDSFSDLLSGFYVGRVMEQREKEAGEEAGNADGNRIGQENRNADGSGIGQESRKRDGINDAEQGKETFIVVSNRNGAIHIGDVPLKEYLNRVFDANYRNDERLNQKAGDVFHLQMGESLKLSVEAFVDYYMQLTGKISGTNQTRIFGVLQGSGKEIGFVYPATRSKYKYFALSGELTAFLVRLYLTTKKDVEFAFLDDFIKHLEDNYGIYIRKCNKTERLVQKYKIRVKQQEFSRNEQAFLETLDQVNCLIRLSDSGYVVTLPEKKGEFKLL